MICFARGYSFEFIYVSAYPHAYHAKGANTESVSGAIHSSSIQTPLPFRTSTQPPVDRSWRKKPKPAASENGHDPGDAPLFLSSRRGNEKAQQRASKVVIDSCLPVQSAVGALYHVAVIVLIAQTFRVRRVMSWQRGGDISCYCIW